MNSLSDKLIEERKQLKPPASYPQRENISQFTEALNGTLRITQTGYIDTLDISTAKSGSILVTTSANEVKILDNNGALSEVLPIDKRVSLAKFAPDSDSVAIFAFSKSENAEGNSVAQVWNLQTKQKLYEVACHTDEITDVCFTPLPGIVAVSSIDGSWSLHDFVNMKKLLHHRESGSISAL